MPLRNRKENFLHFHYIRKKSKNQAHTRSLFSKKQNKCDSQLGTAWEIKQVIFYINIISRQG